MMNFSLTEAQLDSVIEMNDIKLVTSKATVHYCYLGAWPSALGILKLHLEERLVDLFNIRTIPRY